MQKLNELVGLAAAYENAETRKEAFEIVERFNESCGFKSILEIDKAFRALEKRAEAAESECTRLDRESQNLSDQLGACDRERRDFRLNLAELEKQEPVGKQYRVSAKGNNSATGWSLWHDGDGEQYRNSYDVQVRNVFTRPAPAVSLAELVPDAVGIHDMDPDSKDIEVVTAIAQCEGWNACRVAILRKIEEVKWNT